jgi:AbrB family looped-hinge helix DNA binding protein
MFYTVITSKGTTTIPNRVRRELGLTPGSLVKFDKDEKTGQFTITKVLTLEEIQKRNKAYIKNRQPISDKQINEIVSKNLSDRYKKTND